MRQSVDLKSNSGIIGEWNTRNKAGCHNCINRANRKLLGIKRKMRGREDDDIGPAVGDDNSSSSSSDEDNDCGGNKKTGIVYRSDWIVYAKTTHSITASGALEFNVSFKPN